MKPDCHFNQSTHWPGVSAGFPRWCFIFHTPWNAHTALAISTCDVEANGSGEAMTEVTVSVSLSPSHTQSWRFRRGYEYHCKVLAWLILTSASKRIWWQRKYVWRLTHNDRQMKVVEGENMHQMPRGKSPSFPTGAL